MQYDGIGDRKEARAGVDTHCENEHRGHRKAAMPLA